MSTLYGSSHSPLASDVSLLPHIDPEGNLSIIIDSWSWSNKADFDITARQGWMWRWLFTAQQSHIFKIKSWYFCSAIPLAVCLEVVLRALWLCGIHSYPSLWTGTQFLLIKKQTEGGREECPQHHGLSPPSEAQQNCFSLVNTPSTNWRGNTPSCSPSLAVLS